MKFRIFVLGALLMIIGRAVYFEEPAFVNLDESVYMTIAEVANQGGILYKDAVDRKPPGLFWIYQLHGWLFGDWNIHSLHFLYFLIQLVFAVWIWRWTQDRWCFLMVAAYSGAFPQGIVSVNAEFLMLLALIPGFFLLKKWSGSLVQAGAIGALFAVAILIKQVAGLPILLMLLMWVGLEFLRRSWSSPFWRDLGILCLGGCLGGFLVFGSVAVYFWSNNAWSQFLLHNVWSGIRYMGEQVDIESNAPSTWRAIFGVLVSWSLIWMLVARRMLRFKTWNSEILLAGSLFLGLLLTAFLSGRNYSHYFIPIVWTSVFLIAGLGEELWQSTSGRWTRVGIWVMLLLPWGMYSSINLMEQRLGIAQSFSKPVQAEMLSAAREIRSITRPEERILVWGMAAQLYVLAERGASGRYIFSDFVSGRLAGLHSPVSRPFEGAMEEYLEDLKNPRTVLFVDTATAGINDYQFFPLSRFPELQAIVEEYFEPHSYSGQIQIWKRKASG